MELKLSSGSSGNSGSSFKSHLYGIEIYWRGYSFGQSKWFKSHLYGIEIEAVKPCTPARWSLNRTFMELKFRSSFTGHYERRFKSHLYGIEIKKNSTFGKPRYV